MSHAITEELKANYPHVISLGDEEGAREMRIDGMRGGYISTFFLVMGTWDCECEEGYIHWNSAHGGEDYCADCGVDEESMPEARLYEMTDVANCREGFMSEGERAAFDREFVAQGYDEMKASHYEANRLYVENREAEAVVERWRRQDIERAARESAGR